MYSTTRIGACRNAVNPWRSGSRMRTCWCWRRGLDRWLVEATAAFWRQALVQKAALHCAGGLFHWAKPGLLRNLALYLSVGAAFVFPGAAAVRASFPKATHSPPPSQNVKVGLGLF